MRYRVLCAELWHPDSRLAEDGCTRSPSDYSDHPLSKRCPAPAGFIFLKRAWPPIRMPALRSRKACSFRIPSCDLRLSGQETGAGEGNRTLVLSLEGFSSTIELHPRLISRAYAPLVLTLISGWACSLAIPTSFSFSAAPRPTAIHQATGKSAEADHSR